MSPFQTIGGGMRGVGGRIDNPAVAFSRPTNLAQLDQERGTCTISHFCTGAW